MVIHFRRLRRERRMLASALALAALLTRRLAVVRVSLVVVVHVMEGLALNCSLELSMPIGRIAARDPEDVAQLVPLHDVLVRLTRSVLGPAPRADALEDAQALELRADRVRRPRRYARRTRQAVVAAVEHAARRGEPHDRADDLAARPVTLYPPSSRGTLFSSSRRARICLSPCRLRYRLMDSW